MNTNLLHFLRFGNRVKRKHRSLRYPETKIGFFLIRIHLFLKPILQISRSDKPRTRSNETEHKASIFSHKNVVDLILILEERASQKWKEYSTKGPNPSYNFKRLRKREKRERDIDWWKRNLTWVWSKRLFKDFFDLPERERLRKREERENQTKQRKKIWERKENVKMEY